MVEKLEKPTDEIELKHKDVYESPDWKALNGLDRAQLLLVAEGVKPGTIIGGNHKTFLKLVEKLGLQAIQTNDPHSLDPIYEVASPEIISDCYRSELVLPEGANYSESHKINGKFLGYPECCTEEYIHSQKNLKARKSFSPKKIISNFDFELMQLFRSGKSYSEQLDFRPPSFTPCSAHCDNALRLLGQWKKILEKGDPEAAKGLQYFNQKNSPTGKWHRTEIEKGSEGKKAESILRKIRESVASIFK
ncbi:MAG: hypothetical protein WC843_03555 [Candidatus Gracilibacteria bacterium]|jgi:hypothetical protein